MPTYDYVCRECEHAFELFQQMTAPVKRKCPACGKLRLRRLVGTGAGVIFKGSGFYQTDYRSDAYKKAAEADKKSSDGKSEKKVKDKTKSSSTSSPGETTGTKKKKQGDDA